MADEEGVPVVDVRIALATSPRHRRRLLAGAAASGVAAAVVLGVVAAGVGGATTWVGRMSLLGALVLLVGLMVLLTRAARAPGGWLEVGDDHLTLTHPELLRSSIVMPRNAVRTLLVDVGAPPAPDAPAAAVAPAGGPPELVAKFPLVETGDAPAWLHPGARSALPLLGWPRIAPDAALVLRGPLALGTSPRRLLALFEGNEELRALATCAGFFLQLADPVEAGAALAAAGLDAPLTLAEAERLDSLATDRRPRGNRRS